MNPSLIKPLGQKAYGSIGHLPGSRLGPGDHHIHEGQAKICTEKVRDRHDFVVVQEKLDGSCCSVAKINGAIVALGRAGWPAQSSPYEQHQLFAAWVRWQEMRFKNMLYEGERAVGEWLAQAHGTRYTLNSEPFIVFDIMVEHKRATAQEVSDRARSFGFFVPAVLNSGNCAFTIASSMSLLANGGFHGSADPVEGAVWRVERKGNVDFLAKYVRPDKVDGAYLPEVSGQGAIWNWLPPRSADTKTCVQ